MIIKLSAKEISALNRISIMVQEAMGVSDPDSSMDEFDSKALVTSTDEDTGEYTMILNADYMVEFLELYSTTIAKAIPLAQAIYVMAEIFISDVTAKFSALMERWS